MDLPVRADGRSDRGSIASAIRRYLDAKSTLRRTIEDPRHAVREEILVARAAAVGDTHHSASAWDLVAGERRTLLAERLAGEAGLAVFLSDWLALSSAARFRELQGAASVYVRSVVDAAASTRCLAVPLSADLIRHMLSEFGGASEQYVLARTEQMRLERRGVTRLSVEQAVRSARRATVSSAAVVSELISLETDLVALA